MAARPYWKGQIRLALVSIPVEIYSATRSGATIAFNQIHEPTGKRIKYEKVVPGVGAVDPDEIVKGYRVQQGQLRPARRRGARGGQAGEQEDARAHPVRRRARDRPALLRAALLCRAGRRPRRGGVRRAARGAARHEEGRARPARAARPRIYRQPQALRARHPAGDAALCRRGGEGAGLFPRHSRRQARRGDARARRDPDRARRRRSSIPASSTTAMSTR